MSIRNLDKLFKPASVALIGATARDHKLGAIALANLLGGGYQGDYRHLRHRLPVKRAGCGPRRGT